MYAIWVYTILPLRACCCFLKFSKVTVGYFGRNNQFINIYPNRVNTIVLSFLNMNVYVYKMYTATCTHMQTQKI